MDTGELMDARLAIRKEEECSVIERVIAAYGEKYSPLMMSESKRDVAELLHEKVEIDHVRERLPQKWQEHKNRRNSRDTSRKGDMGM